MIMYSVFKVHPGGRAEFVADAGSLSTANMLASQHSATQPFYCVVKGIQSIETRHFRNGRLSDN